jgi:ribose/xylose/arabinose/galactoside ABC-type transport system permease subunit
MSTLRIVLQPGFRPYLILAIVVLLLATFDAGQGRFLTIATAFSALQTFAAFGLVALGLGLTMLIGEFDLSVAGVFGLAGCVALLMGTTDPWVGIACALGIGLVFGIAQGLLITRLELGSVPVTLGGLLTATGTAYVVTGNRAVSSDHVELALALDEPMAGVLSIHSLIALGVFALAGIVFSFTRLGRDLIALGSDRRASIIAGVSVDRLVIGSFVFSALTAALGGTLLSLGLATASPSGLSDVLVPAAAAAILGGVSLAGGTGTPMGVAAGVLTLAVLRSGLNAIAAPPFAHDLATGLILLAVAISDAPFLWHRLIALRARVGLYSGQSAVPPRQQ